MSEELQAVHHVAINVADIDRALKWYLNSFSCRVLQQEKTFAVLEFANLKLVLCLPSQEPPHLAYTRSDAASFGQLELRADGLRSTFLADVAGNMIEIAEPE